MLIILINNLTCNICAQATHRVLRSKIKWWSQCIETRFYIHGGGGGARAS